MEELRSGVYGSINQNKYIFHAKLRFSLVKRKQFFLESMIKINEKTIFLNYNDFV